ncbi:capsular polysaccharide transport system permease protein [Novosphingobium sp. PhB55]|uniref:capsule biosynthesis protein n=1 Tax=Novosphingobium sp. PhB55 TaxID=2485106 RepID=UPI0010EF9718|nr:capsule biosynthesis protein [Novosphingobium sp. PhB55]TDW59224.1 capsular polysaccharide transport system permease protein [Novosphingobium sp. PhB55]
MGRKIIEGLKRWRWFVLFVGVPTLIASIYYGMIASDVYVSESRFVVKTSGQKQSAMPSALSGLIQTAGLSSGQDQAREIVDYIQSRDALQALSKRIDVRDIFMSEKADWLSRYPGSFDDDSFEALYRYYQSMVGAATNVESGTTVLTVKAFDPHEAQALNQRLLNLSEALVNRLNERANAKEIAEARTRVNEAQMRVRKARIELSQYRNNSELLDPQQQGLGVLEVSNGLIAQQAALNAKLFEIRKAAPNHPSIPALKQRIAALSQQIAAQSGRAVGTPSGIASKLSGYEALTVEQEFATQMLTAANASLEQARADAVKQQYYLERIVEANTPDEAMLPNRMKQIVTVLFASLCLYLVGWMLVVGILEHAPDD